MSDDLVWEVRRGYVALVEAAIGNATRRMQGHGMPAAEADEIAAELAHAAGSAFQFIAAAAQDAGRDLREFMGDEGGDRP